jgi:aldose 1-epimerase
VDSLLIPTGEQRPVASSPFDFREFRSIGDRITQEHPQLQHGNGYDHNFVLLKSPEQLALAAEVQANTLQLELWTNHPGLQLYTGNFLSPRVKGKNQQIYDFRNGFSLTPQHFPDSPHQPTFPPAILAPGQTYRHSILFKIKSL